MGRILSKTALITLVCGAFFCCHVSGYKCELKPPPILNYVCNRAACEQDVYPENLNPNSAFCCYCNRGVCAKTARYQHGAPLTGEVVSCQISTNADGTGALARCSKDSDCDLRGACANKLFIDGKEPPQSTIGVKNYTFYETRWPLGLPPSPVCDSAVNLRSLGVNAVLMLLATWVFYA